MKRALVALAILVSPLAAAAAPIGPTYPNIGGNSFASSGGVGITGGVTRTYAALDGTSYSDLWWGVYDIVGPFASFVNGSSQGFGTSPSIGGNTAIWNAVSPWTIDMTGGADVVTPVRFRLSAFQLDGITPWNLTASGLVSGLAGSGGAVLNVGLASGFVVNMGFEAWNGSTWVGTNSFFNSLGTQACTGQFGPCVINSVNGGFWYQENVVPEPAALSLLGISLVFGAHRLRRRNVA